MATKQEKIKIPVVLVGLGRIGMRHLEVLRRLERRGRCVIKAVVDQNIEAARQRGQNIPVFCSLEACFQEMAFELFTDKRAAKRAVDVFRMPLDELLCAPLPEAIGEAPILAFATPSGLHFEQAVRTLYADCHLLMEKPVAMTRDEAKILETLNEKSQRKTAVGHIYRYYPVMKELQETIREGVFGAPYYAEVGVRWGHDAAYYQPAWRGTKASDGGALLNQSIHGFDLATWFLGGDQVVESYAMTANYRHDIEAEDFGVGMVRFDNGAILVLDGATSSSETLHEARFTFILDRGEIRLAIVNGKIKLSVRDEKGKERRLKYLKEGLLHAWKKVGRDLIFLFKRPHLGIYMDLLTAVAEDGETRADLGAGAAAVLLTESLVEDAQQRHERRV